ncbi:Flp family type IVb pilin [Pseudomonas daroniae]|uniref:Flp family type IVb pilin n=1 Tax=Phytopseudomonas daroniae TaxID=2487519 RepID=A0A4Q9QQ53_9GAMM|nr:MULTISPECIES: Flp family type IVb pilin [Pseudomonas]TBU81629.1 Flp family type IVb pilin [Pseudomonas daroniae]TBU84207.1 Flp family type IVb pilin [Pseudomonas sp. FRB 228]TBU88569.1 Flp family type IVb pilin [Pseudomonas daroniae]
MNKPIMLREKVRDFFAREEGASAIEYSIIAALIAVVIVTAAGAVGDNIVLIFENIRDALAIGE